MKTTILSLYTFDKLIVMLNNSPVKRDKYGFYFGASR